MIKRKVTYIATDGEQFSTLAGLKQRIDRRISQDAVTLIEKIVKWPENTNGLHDWVVDWMHNHAKPLALAIQDLEQIKGSNEEDYEWPT